LNAPRTFTSENVIIITAGFVWRRDEKLVGFR